MSRSTLPIALLFASTLPATAQSQSSIPGNWRTPGGAVIRVAACGTDPQMLCATVLQLEPNAPTHVDANNPDAAKRGRPLCGLQIGYGFHLTDPNHATDGHLYDPKTGKTYKGTMTGEGNTLNLRGYIGFSALGRTDRWTRTSETPTCKS